MTSRMVPKAVLGEIKDRSREAWLQPKKSNAGTNTERKIRKARRG